MSARDNGSYNVAILAIYYNFFPFQNNLGVDFDLYLIVPFKCTLFGIKDGTLPAFSKYMVLFSILSLNFNSIINHFHKTEILCSQLPHYYSSILVANYTHKTHLGCMQSKQLILMQFILTHALFMLSFQRGKESKSNLISSTNLIHSISELQSFEIIRWQKAPRPLMAAVRSI